MESVALKLLGRFQATIDENPITDFATDNVRAFFGAKVYETIIPRNTRVAEAPSHGKPILLYDFDCAGSQAYIKLATEIIERERQNQAA